jgi:Type II secretion system (T2SS), protein M
MNLRARDRVALGIVVVLALLGAYYMLALKPERQKVSALDAQIASQRQTLSQEQQQYASGRAAQAALKADAAEWAALRLAVPAQSDIPALLRTLEKTSNSVHVKMQSITLTGSSGATPAAPTSGSSSASTSGSSPASSSSGATPVPIQLSFKGGYTALNSLVHRLDSLVVLSGGKVHATGPLLSISNVTLSGSSSLTGQLNATIYQLAAPSSAAGATGGHP